VVSDIRACNDRTAQDRRQDETATPPMMIDMRLRVEVVDENQSTLYDHIAIVKHGYDLVVTQVNME